VPSVVLSILVILITLITMLASPKSQAGIKNKFCIFIFEVLNSDKAQLYKFKEIQEMYLSNAEILHKNHKPIIMRRNELHLDQRLFSLTSFGIKPNQSEREYNIELLNAQAELEFSRYIGLALELDGFNAHMDSLNESYNKVKHLIPHATIEPDFHRSGYLYSEIHQTVKLISANESEMKVSEKEIAGILKSLTNEVEHNGRDLNVDKRDSDEVVREIISRARIYDYSVSEYLLEVSYDLNMFKRFIDNTQKELIKIKSIKADSYKEIEAKAISKKDFLLRLAFFQKQLASLELRHFVLRLSTYFEFIDKSVAANLKIKGQIPKNKVSEFQKLLKQYKAKSIEFTQTMLDLPI